MIGNRCFLRGASSFFEKNQNTSKFCLCRSIESAMHECFPGKISLNNVLWIENCCLRPSKNELRKFFRRKQCLFTKTSLIVKKGVKTSPYHVSFRRTKHSIGQSRSFHKWRKWHYDSAKILWPFFFNNDI